MRKSVLSAVVAAAIVVGTAGSGQATVSNWSAQVNSSGLMKYHVNNRTTTIAGPWTAVTVGPSSGAKIVFTDCAGYATPLTEVKTIKRDLSAAMGTLTVGTCFRMGVGRAVGADTNGWLAGYGVTDLAGRVEY